MFSKIAEQAWLQLGAVGLLIVFLFIAIWYLVRYIRQITQDHKDERVEWRLAAQGQTDKMLNVVQQNSTVVSQLCTLIKSRRE